MGRPDLDQIHLLVAFCPFLPHQAANKLTSYFSRAELKEGSARRAGTKYFDPFSSLGARAGAPSFAILQKVCHSTPSQS